jgi:HD superfamily phosphohydrolase
VNDTRQSGAGSSATERMYRDPVHNIISLAWTDPTERLLIDLVDSSEFQRLRRIKQLGLALYTYQGAEHSRFTHSLGVMYVMRRVLDRLARRHTIPDDVRRVALCAALLHDVGHGPFSHVIEKVLHYTHERRTVDILLDDRTQVHRVLAECDPRLPEQIASVYDYAYRPAFVCQLVSSQLDVDRCDYLLRDSLMTGAKYGMYDLEWILRHLQLDGDGQRVYVGHKGIYAVEEYLQARYYMFRQVYFHRSLRGAEAVLLSTLRRAVELLAAGKLDFYLRESVFERLLRREHLAVPDYLELDDHDLIFHIKRWRSEADPILSDLARRFIDRQLFKTIDLDFAGDREPDFVAQAREAVAAAGFDPEYYFIRDSASDIPYYGYYTPDASDARANIYVETGAPEPEIREISEVSQVVRGMRGYQIHRLCFPAEALESVHAVARSVVST